MTYYKRLFVPCLILALLPIFLLFPPLRHPPATPTPTLSLTPTYPHLNTDLLPQFIDLMNTENCQLPCWWGLQPGISTASDIKQLLEKSDFFSLVGDGGGPFLLDRTNDRIAQSISFNFSGSVDSGEADISWTVENRELKTTKLFFRPGEWLPNGENRLSLPHILAEMNSTPAVYIFTNFPEQIFLNELTFYFVYEEAGVLIEYTFDIGDDQPQPADWTALKFCPSIKNTVWLQMWLEAPSEKQDITRFIPGGMGGLSTPTLATVFNVDAETLTSFFVEHPDDCMEIGFLDAIKDKK